KLRFDDALDVFAVHGVGGIVGNLLTGIFASKSIAALNGADIAGGWIDHHWKQFGFQLAGSCAGAAWSFFVTALILYIFNIIPGLHLRIHEEGEVSGTDITEMGEHGYKFATIEPTVGRDDVSLSALEQGKLQSSLAHSTAASTEKPEIAGQ
ncbi:hypothetical protein IWW50_006975, partial [Coemansia erecta]